MYTYGNKSTVCRRNWDTAGKAVLAMPRRKKEENMSFEERIQQVDQRIADCKETLVSLKSQRKSLETARDSEAMQSIYELIKASNMSPTEFLTELQRKTSLQEIEE
jgi:hypothetical protein